jgi:predicted ATPase
LGDQIAVGEQRIADSGERFTVLRGLVHPAIPSPHPALSPTLDLEMLKPWVLPVVYEREKDGLGAFIPELRPAVALFLRFTGIDYDADEQSGEKLDALIRRAQSILARYEGYLLQLTMGDKGSYLQASFGVPVNHEDDAQRAALAAWELNQLNQAFEFLEPVQIGISAGTMRAGPYGGPTRYTYGAMGDDTNLAARLMTTAAPGEILVSSRVYKRIMGVFNCEPRPPLPMKGKAEPLPIFAISSPRRLRAIRLEEPIYSLPMMGRRAELELIQTKLDLAAKGQGQVIGITGEAGMGKSRLVAEAIRLAFQNGFTAYGGTGEASGTNTPYLVWKPIWQAFFDIDPASPPRRQLRNLEGEIEDRAPSRLPAVPVLSTLLGMEIEENDFTINLEPQDRRNVLTALLEDCLKSAAREEPHLLVLEDAHWIDPLSHDLLENLARVCVNLPVCILLAYRPPDIDRLQKERIETLAHFTPVEILPLGAAESEQLIRAKLAQLYPEQVASLPKALVENLIAHAEGNPFYIEELLNYMRDRGLDPYKLDALQSIDLPSSLHTLILSRIDQLTETQKTMLKAASIIGRLFKVSWLYRYYPFLGSQELVKENLDRLAQIDLTPLDTPEPELAYFFKHIITREVAYESLAYTTRAQLHELLAQFIESLGEEQNLNLLAYHYSLSGNKAKQLKYLQKAGDAAKAVYANEAALEYYQLLLPLLTTPEDQANLNLSQGEILELTGKWQEAEAAYRSALENSQKTGELLALIRSEKALGALLRMRSDYPAALNLLEMAIQHAKEISHGLLQAQAHREIGKIYELTGKTALAQEHYKTCLELALENHDLKTEAIARLALGSFYTETGDYSIGQSFAEDGLKIMSAIGDKKGISIALTRLGLLSNYQGNSSSAMAYYEQALAISREIGDKWTISALLNNLASIASQQGESDKAQALHTECITIAQEIGDKWSLAHLLMNTGVDAVEKGDFHAAQAAYNESLKLLREIDDKPGYAFTQLNLGYMACEQNDYERAHQSIREGLEIFYETDSKWGIVYSLIGLSSVYAAKDRLSEAVKLASAAETLRSSINLALAKDGSRLYERALAIARDGLCEIDYNTAWESGQQLTAEHVRIMIR